LTGLFRPLRRIDDAIPPRGSNLDATFCRSPSEACEAA
jgi:hypothetical protein